MKRIFTLIALLALHYAASAQLVVFSENFDEMPSYSISGWPYEYSGSSPWQCGLPALVGICIPPIGGPMSYEGGTNKIACIPDCGVMNPNDSNVLTYTPPINLSAISGAWLRYDSYFNEYHDSWSDTERATVEVSTDDGATWTVIQHVHASVPYGTFNTFYLDLSAYNGISDIRIGFRYSDDGGFMDGWAIDNVEVFVPAQKDLSLLSMTPVDPLLSYVVEGQSYAHNVQVFNAGLDTIHTFALNYQRAGGSVQSQTITGVDLLPFSTTNFTHDVPDTIPTVGSFPVTMWVSLPGDAYHYNDTVKATLHGAAFMPGKRITMECGDGTWYAWSPRDYVYYDSVQRSDIAVNCVSVHYGDPMEDTAYNDYMLNMGGGYMPYMFFDRRTKVPMDSFFEYVNVQRRYFGFADLSVGGYFDGTNLIVNTTVTPAIDLNGDYRLALVLTEDSVTGTGPYWAQNNVYASGTHGELHGYESLPQPVPDNQMAYKYVARGIYPDAVGAGGCLPVDLSATEVYSYSFNVPISPSWRPSKLHASVLLIQHSDSVILNSAVLPWALETNTPVLSQIETHLYPVPADVATTLSFYLPHEDAAFVTVTDLNGRTLYTSPSSHFAAGNNKVSIPVQQLATGLYMVSLATPETRTTLKLEVLH